MFQGQPITIEAGPHNPLAPRDPPDVRGAGNWMVRDEKVCDLSVLIPAFFIISFLLTKSPENLWFRGFSREKDHSFVSRGRSRRHLMELFAEEPMERPVAFLAEFGAVIAAKASRTSPSDELVAHDARCLRCEARNAVIGLNN